VSGLQTTEAGGKASFNVVLDSQPTASVTIGLSSSDTGEGSVSPTSLSFTTENWGTPQKVTVTGVDDSIDDGDQSYTVVTGAAVSTDPNYQNFDPADVSVTNSDDDAVGIDVYPISGLTTNESGSKATFSVVLESKPTSDVTLHLTSTKTTEGIIAPDILVFSTENWNEVQDVTITGVDDNVDDGNVPYTILTGPAGSNDQKFNGINPPDVSVTNLDDDHTPVAEPDAYITNGILEVAAPGVLVNDSDEDISDALHAVLQSNVRNGSLTLHDDGSFEYIPDLLFAGEDNFTYRASDGTNTSSIVEVRITVDRYPTIEWLSPVVDGMQMTITNSPNDRIIQLEVNASDINDQIQRVRFYRHDANISANVEIGNVYQPPYRIELNTSILNCGWNQINAKAYDMAGNVSELLEENDFIWLIRYCYVYMPNVNR
jgi:hypothetical protein